MVNSVKTITRDRRAQMLGQVIVFVLAAIIFVLILGYGYRAIISFQEQGRQVALLDFKTELETAIESISRDYGSVRTITLITPSEFTGLCIVDSQDAGRLRDTHPLLYNAWRSGSENVFLLPITKQSFPIKLEHIEVYGTDGKRGFLCFENTRSIKLRLEGMGDRTKVIMP